MHRFANLLTIEDLVNRSMKNVAVLAVVGFLAFWPLASSQAAKPAQESKQLAKLSRQIESIAADFSSYLADNENRALLSAQIKAARRKYVMVMQDFLAVAASKDLEKGGEHLFNLAIQVDQVEATMKDFGLPIPRLEVKLPVKAHRELLNESEAVYVAAVPLVDESEVKSITAYTSKGDRITLSADEPPRIPTFVITPAEEESLEPEHPLIMSDKPGKEENPERVVDDFIGIPWIRITDDHESWPCGDPEIYVKIWFWIQSNGYWQVIKSIANLKYVNDEYVWYWLGELGYNNTYRKLIGSDWKNIYYEIWEADSGAHGNDDFLGSRYVTWKDLPFGGYTKFSAGDAKIYVDRD